MVFLFVCLFTSFVCLFLLLVVVVCFVVFFAIVVFSYLVCLFVLLYFIIGLFVSWFPFMSLMCFLFLWLFQLFFLIAANGREGFVLSSICFFFFTFLL